MRPFLVSIFILICLSALVAQDKEALLIETIDDVPCEDAMGRLDLLFAEVSNRGPNVTGVVIYYEGKYKDRTYTQDGKLVSTQFAQPVFGEIQQRVRWLQNYTNFRNFPKDQIRFISGGYRESWGIDLWIVTVGSPLPKPTPSKEKIKYRKGDFTEFYCN